MVRFYSSVDGLGEGVEGLDVVSGFPIAVSHTCWRHFEERLERFGLQLGHTHLSFLYHCMLSLGMHNAAFIASRILACDAAGISVSGEAPIHLRRLHPSHTLPQYQKMLVLYF